MLLLCEIWHVFAKCVGCSKNHCKHMHYYVTWLEVFYFVLFFSPGEFLTLLFERLFINLFLFIIKQIMLISLATVNHLNIDGSSMVHIIVYGACTDVSLMTVKGNNHVIELNGVV